MIDNHSDLAKYLARLIRETMEFGEFIHSQNVDKYGTIVLHAMKEIEDILESESPLLPKPMLNDFEYRIIEYFLQWNEKFEKQAREFYNVYKIIEEKSKTPFANVDGNPLNTIMKNLERYKMANKKIENVIQKYRFTSIDEIDFYSMFFAIVAMSEAVEYYFRQDLQNHLDKYQIPNIDLQKMFSLTEKWINKKGLYVSDIRGIRNAVSHFNFDITYDENDINFIIQFNKTPQGKEESKTMRANEIIDFLSNYKFMLQTFEHILFFLFIFSMLKQFFSIDGVFCEKHTYFSPEHKPCPSCS